MRSPTTYDYDHLDYEEDSDGYDFECKRAQWPRQLDYDGVKKWTIIVVWVSIAVAVIHMLAIVGIVISIFVKDITGTVGDDFVFYKNTRFQECAAMALDPADCSAIRNLKSDLYPDPDRYIKWPMINETYDWCEAISCYNGFKVIPSTANDSAMGMTSLGAWWFFATTAFGLMWAFKTSCPIFHRQSRVTERCRGFRDISVLDWIVLIYEICGPIAWWIISFFLLIAYPKPSPTLSTTAWMVTWKYSYLVQIHPLSCILARGPTYLRKALPWSLGLLAFMQWVATIYLNVVGLVNLRENQIYPSYTCLADQIASAPGAATCTASELCAKSWMFTAGKLLSSTGERYSWQYLGLFVLGTVVCAFYLMFLGQGIPGVTTKGMAQRWAVFKKYYFKWNPTLGLAMYGVVVVWLIGLLTAFTMSGLITGLIPSWGDRRADAVVAVDHACHAVHVYLSPWRCYLDFRYDRELRMAKMWFGV
ncbi:hypothetical protein BJX64DRAFT_259182 [Aspergillus heterothallicus]